MKHWPIRSRPRPEVLCGLVLLLLGGCVTRSTHREVVAERDRFAQEAQRYAKRSAMLEDTTESLNAERVELIDRIEDLRIARAQLDQEVSSVARAREELERELAERTRALEARDTERRRLESTYEALVADLESEVSTGRIQIEQMRSGLRLNLSDELIFGSGSAELNAAGRKVLGRVAKQVRELSQRIEVQGHTDNVPIRGPLAARFPTNWELAGARAARVVRALAEGGVPADRLTASSHGDTRPVASNDTEEGRARNRRVEIRLLPAGPDAPGGASPVAPASGP